MDEYYVYRYIYFENKIQFYYNFNNRLKPHDETQSIDAREHLLRSLSSLRRSVVAAPGKALKQLRMDQFLTHGQMKVYHETSGLFMEYLSKNDGFFHF